MRWWLSCARHASYSKTAAAPSQKEAKPSGVLRHINALLLFANRAGFSDAAYMKILSVLCVSDATYLDFPSSQCVSDAAFIDLHCLQSVGGAAYLDFPNLQCVGDAAYFNFPNTSS